MLCPTLVKVMYQDATVWTGEFSDYPCDEAIGVAVLETCDRETINGAILADLMTRPPGSRGEEEMVPCTVGGVLSMSQQLMDDIVIVYVPIITEELI